MGSNLGNPKAFSAPTEDDIKQAWRAVAKLDSLGYVTSLGRSVARCVYAIEQMREALGMHRPDVQEWTFKKGDD